MLNAVIDIGNSVMKVAFFEEKGLKMQKSLSEESQLVGLFSIHQPEHTLLSSVSIDPFNLQQQLIHFSDVHILTHQTPLPIQNLYETPHSLGVDRLAAAIGAKTLYPASDCLVIDVGTCITLDFIDKENNYRGGNISPGLQMRFKAMNQFTAKLPLLNADTHHQPTLTGKNTVEAMFNGVVNGIVFEIEGTLRAYRDNHPALVTVLCGGDTNFFESKTKEQIFAVPNLTLIGLNTILRHNVGKKD